MTPNEIGESGGRKEIRNSFQAVILLYPFRPTFYLTSTTVQQFAVCFDVRDISQIIGEQART